QICKKSMQAMLSDLQKPIPEAYLQATPIENLKHLSPKSKEKLGRLNTILYKRPKDEKFEVLQWDEAFTLLLGKMKATDPSRSFFYASGRSSNEAAFLLQLFARCYRTNNVNNC